MLGKWFRKRPTRSLDALIFDLAEHHRDSDFEEFHERMQSHLFYLPLAKPLAGAPGAKVIVGAGVEARYVTLQDKKMFVFFTTDSHADLGPAFAGVEGVEALRMTVASPDADGAVFQNDSASWVGMSKQKCQEVLASSAR